MRKIRVCFPRHQGRFFFPRQPVWGGRKEKEAERIPPFPAPGAVQVLPGTTFPEFRGSTVLL